jgi:hypothetical protein
MVEVNELAASPGVSYASHYGFETALDPPPTEDQDNENPFTRAGRGHGYRRRRDGDPSASAMLVEWLRLAMRAALSTELQPMALRPARQLGI